MSPAIPCPQGEEFSALLDWELAPERLPLLEKHIEECEKCCAHYLRLAAADRMLGLAIGEVHLLAACLTAAPGEKDPPTPALVAQLEEAGRDERVATLQEIARIKTRRHRKLLICAAVILVLLIGGFFAALQPSPVKALSGGARSEAGYVLARGDGQATLCDGTRVDLAPGTVVAFRATWRWEQPRAELVAGKLTVVEGRLTVRLGQQTREIPKGGSIGPPGAQLPAPPPAPAPTPAPAVPPAPEDPKAPNPPADPGSPG